MPELPEVETMVRGIRSHVVGRQIRNMRLCRTSCKPISIVPDATVIARKVAGQTIVGVRRLAKRVVLDLADATSLVIEPRMTGLMLVADPPDHEHLRVEWLLGNRQETSLWFWDRRGLGTVRHYGVGELAQQLGPDRLGPDALTATLEEWRSLCARTARPIKVALLDQKLIAGIGNLYASEILHRARVHPATPASRLTRTQVARLQESAQHVLAEAIRYEGSTLSDGTYRNALNQNGGYQNAHRVYDRAETVCPSCGQAPIERIVQAQRSTFFCPRCQRQPR